jgi:hypothetical protein
MSFALPNAPLFSYLRRRRRGVAWAAVWVVCLQLLAGGIASVHAAQQALGGFELALSDVCHGTASGGSAGTADGAPADTDDGLPPVWRMGGGHCPFCHLAASLALPSDAALSFPPPEPATFFVPARDARLQPSAPDSCHAPKRAPPFSFA